MYKYDAPHHLPPEPLRAACRRLAAAAGRRDRSPPTAGLVNYYRSCDAPWGVDDAEANLDRPIVSLSLGCPAVFLLGVLTRAPERRAVLLRSGDAAVLTGATRRWFHGVPRIFAGRRASSTPTRRPVTRAEGTERCGGVDGRAKTRRVRRGREGQREPERRRALRRERARGGTKRTRAWRRSEREEETASAPVSASTRAREPRLLSAVCITVATRARPSLRRLIRWLVSRAHLLLARSVSLARPTREGLPASTFPRASRLRQRRLQPANVREMSSGPPPYSATRTRPSSWRRRPRDRRRDDR